MMVSESVSVPVFACSWSWAAWSCNRRLWSSFSRIAFVARTSNRSLRRSINWAWKMYKSIRYLCRESFHISVTHNGNENFPSHTSKYNNKFRYSFCGINLRQSITMLSPRRYPKMSNEIFNIGERTLQTNWRFIGLGVLHKSSKLATAGEILNRSDRTSVKTGARQTSTKSNYPAALTTDSLSGRPINASTIHLCTTLLHSLYFVFYTAWPGGPRLAEDKIKLKRFSIR